MTTDRRWTSPAAVEVKSQLFRALAVLRVIVLVHAVGLGLFRFGDFTSASGPIGGPIGGPVGGAVALATMIGWTAYATFAYADPRRRGAPLLVTDLAVTVALLASSPLVKGEDFVSSVPGFWTMGALLAWAIQYRRAGGLAAGLLLATVDLLVRPEVTQTNLGNAFLLVLGGLVVGHMCEALQSMAVEREEAQRAAAISAERSRLARVVHDGTLQVLALVQRKGTEAGGELGELGRLAGEQERELRALIREQASFAAPSEEQVLDLVAELGRLESDAHVTVAAPATRVELPAPTAQELLAAVRAGLDNIRRHVGEQAPAWVLLEASPDGVQVTLRDEGPGIPEGRLEEAAGEGRLGVAASIRGRMADLGGTAKLITGPGGTEWELVLPRAPQVMS